MHLLVIGSEGQLGTALRNTAVRKGMHSCIFLSKADLDITNFAKVDEYFQNNFVKDAVIINCAAYTDVEKAESEPETALQVNSIGVKNLAESCRRSGIKFIHISTDFVFNGLKKGLYNESDMPDPVSIYGKSKAEGEKAVLENPENCLIIRTSWIYSTTHNTFVNKIIEKSKTNAQLKVVDDETGSPTYAPDLAEALIQICGRISEIENIKTAVYHYCNTGSVSRYEYAKKIIDFTKATTEVVPVKSNELNMKAKRPANSSLDNSKIISDFKLKIRNWDEALKEAVEKING
jgi:dTDP-4-dehydrorhamnose reductase